MANVSGIQVKLKTTSQMESSSSDRIYLGIYSLNGGREFRLNLGINFLNEDEIYHFALGQTCCSENVPMVTHSTNMGTNDPLYNPIDIDNIQFVYLRKENESNNPNVSSNDDDFSISFLDVLICDKERTLRRYRNTEAMIFSQFSGMKHWIPRAEVPGCKIVFDPLNITHELLDGSVGNDWRLEFYLNVGGKRLTAFGPEFEPRRHAGIGGQMPAKKPWTYGLERHAQWEFFPGCCPKSFSATLRAHARENDIAYDDEKTVVRYITISCEDDVSETFDKIELEVEGVNEKGKVKLTYNYRLKTECLNHF